MGTGPDQHYLAAARRRRGRGSAAPSIRISPPMPRTSIWCSRRASTVSCRSGSATASPACSATPSCGTAHLLGAPIPWDLRDPARAAIAARCRSCWRDARVAGGQGSVEARSVRRRDLGVRALPDVRRAGQARGKLNAYAKLVSTGREPATAFAETLGPVEALEARSAGTSSSRYSVSPNQYRRERRAREVSRRGRCRRRRRPRRWRMFHAVMRRPVESTRRDCRGAESRSERRRQLCRRGTAGRSAARQTRRRRRLQGPRSSARRARTRTIRLASLTWQPNGATRHLTEIDSS